MFWLLIKDGYSDYIILKLGFEATKEALYKAVVNKDFITKAKVQLKVLMSMIDMETDGQYIKIETPPTPLHPAPNEEAGTIPGTPIGGALLDDLDLNPELEKSSSNTNHVQSKGDAFDNGSEEPSEWEDQLFEESARIKQKNVSSYRELADYVQTSHTPKLSLQQQSRFINYLDDKLLSLQRKFIKAHVDSDVMDLDELIKELQQFVDLVYYSISPKCKLFGQQHYLIRILGDMDDYINKFELKTFATWKNLFDFLHSLDTKVSFLIDGYELQNDDGSSTGITEKLGATEMVRLNAICLRLRMLVVEKMGDMKNSFFQEEFSSLLESILERTS